MRAGHRMLSKLCSDLVCLCALLEKGTGCSEAVLQLPY